MLDSRDLLEHTGGMLRALCAALSIPFDAAMLSWPPGPRDTDGVWGPYWYESVWASTGFGPYRAPAGELPPGLADLAQRCRPYYEHLYARRLTPAQGPDGAKERRHPTRRSPVLQAFDERNRDVIVSVGGHLTHRSRAAVSPFDSSVQGGDAVWEGLRLYEGRIFRLDEHLARLRRSAKALAFETVPARRGDHRADQADPAGQRDDRQRAHQAHPHPG